MDNKSALCMADNGKDIKHTKKISRIVHFVRNGENWKMHNIDWCERGLQLADIATNNVGDNDLSTRIKYILLRIYNWEITLVQ